MHVCGAAYGAAGLICFLFRRYNFPVFKRKEGIDKDKIMVNNIVYNDLTIRGMKTRKKRKPYKKKRSGKKNKNKSPYGLCFSGRRF